MKRAGKVKWGELKVGILIAIALAFALYASFRGGGTSIFESKSDYVTYFADLDGLSTGSPVWLAGVEVGNVQSISFLERPVEIGKDVEVRIRIKGSVAYLITPGTIVQIGTIGLLGDKYVKIIPGPPSEIKLADESVISTSGSAGLGGAIEAMPETVKRFNRILASAENILARVDTGEGTFSKLISDPELAQKIVGLVDRSSALASALEEESRQISRDVGDVKSDFHALSVELLEGKGTISRLLKDPEPFENLVSSTARLDSILSKVESGSGTAGMLLNDVEIYSDLKDLVERVNTLVKNITDNPKKYLKFSVF
jgi:phospholipid/cholesterol/gamma-HCH transport system substrate-binding protein